LYLKRQTVQPANYGAQIRACTVNINGGLDAFITLENYPHVPLANPNDQAVGQLDRTDLDDFDKNFKTGRTAQYSLDLQRQLPHKFAVQVSYIGSKGTRLRSNFDPINKIPLNALKLGLPLLQKPLAAVTSTSVRSRQALVFRWRQPLMLSSRLRCSGRRIRRHGRAIVEGVSPVRNYQQSSGKSGQVSITRVRSM
jgi:hypothetical protein